jgi:hypothetical protein
MPFSVKRIKDPTASADKYARKTAAAGADWLAGYKAPKRDPRAAAVAANPRWKNSLQAAMQADRYAHKVGSYDVDGAIKVAEAVGQQAYVAGTAARHDKVLSKLGKIIAAQQKILAQADTMPTDTLAHRLAKANFIATEMNKLKGTF